MAAVDRSVIRSTEVSGCKFPVGFSAEAIKSAIEYKPHDDDFFVATYPKCGTTWTQQTVHLIFNRGEPITSTKEFFVRSPFLELFGKESAEQLHRPGGIKIHLPFNLTPHSTKAKYLYVVRNPKDTLVSFYHHATTDTLVLFQDGSFDTFFEGFINGTVPYGDYFDHVLGWYEHRNDPNVMFITFEEMKKDRKNSVLKIAKFMGEEWHQMLQNEPEVLDKVLKYSSVEYMKSVFNPEFFGKPEDDPGVANTLYPGMKQAFQFIEKYKLDTDKKFTIVRKGNVGDWKTELSKEQIAKLDAKIDEKLKNTDMYAYWKSINCI